MRGRQVVEDAQVAFKGGLNTTADESQVAPDEIREAGNVRLTEYGGATKRLGTQRTHDDQLNASGSITPIRGGFTWRKTSPATHLVVSDGHLWTAPQGAYPWGFADQGAGFDLNQLVSMVSFRDLSTDVVYLADGGQASKWSAGGILTLNIAGSPNVARLAVHNLRLFAVGDPTSPETIYFSGLSNGDTLGDVANGGGSAIVRTFGHEPLTGLLAVGQSLLMFHERGISRFTGWGQDDFSIDDGTRGVTQDVGTIAPNSILAVENVGFFLSDRGAYAVTESGVQQISAKVESILGHIPATDLRLVSAGHNRLFREVWFAIPNLGVMVYNYRLQAWSGPLDGSYLTLAPLVFWESGADETSRLLFGGNDAIVRQADVEGSARDDLTANGIVADELVPAAYVMNLRCHRMFFDDPTTEKSLRFVYVVANLRGSEGTALGWEMGDSVGSAQLPLESTTAVWGGASWGAFQFGRSGSTTERVHAFGRGKYADIKIVDDGISNPVYSRIEAQGYNMGRRY